MNNREWLYSLDVADLSDWFDAEHEESAQLKDMFGILGNLPTDPGEAAIAAVEGFVRERSNDTFRGENDAKAGRECPNDENGTLDGDTEPENADSRDKLEADIRKYANPEGNTGTLGACWERKMLEFIDRQAAITEQEVEHDLMKAGRMAVEVERERIKKLTAERDKLKELNGYHAAQYELASEDCDRLQAQVDAKDNCIENIMQTLHETQARASNLADDLLTANRQREQYRKLFGMALDWAHEITMLESSIDEGMA